MEKLIEFLKKEFPDGIQMFNTKNWVGDPMYTIYKKDGIVVEYCSRYEYIEVFGLSIKEFSRLNAEINGQDYQLKDLIDLMRNKWTGE